MSVINTIHKAGQVFTLTDYNELITGFNLAVRPAIGLVNATGSFVTGVSFNYLQVGTISVNIQPTRQRAYLRLFGHIEASTTATAPQQMVFSIGKSAVDIYDYESYVFNTANQTYNFPVDMRVLVSTQAHTFTFWAWQAAATGVTTISKVKLGLYVL